ncbi:MAG: DUF3667 domain-containing protein [Gammaproteobacteria bacterium]|nr:DUF3667 domain-containing protein [Gammaproteobacteria bacterium]MDH5303173.1 DUF3667 domain-containing protein [Gammaproteobacteria bacterium]MDH5320819.1 DUF3667 domain-containing protein [Gammaproteobacteria bacterium]
MPTTPGPVYEVTLFVDRNDVAVCEQWLHVHVEAARLAPAVAQCTTFPIAHDDEGRAGRICEYRFASDEALDAFLADSGTAIESFIASHCANSATVSARVLREDLTHDFPPSDAPNCLNCGTHLRGQYCGHCGQRSRSRLISLWELISDAFGDLFELDSRLWKTITPLLLKPGRLTSDYLQGRRARFMPPFRMYLVMSVVFFVVAFFDPREEFGLFFEPAVEAEPAAEAEAKEGQDLVVSFGDSNNETIEEDCDIEADGIEELPDFLARRLSVERLKQVCKQVVADKGKSLSAKVLDNTPAALIVLLPLMALVMKAIYPLSRRYYVEHLLFFVHFHSFVFLLLTLEILFTRLATALQVTEIATTVTVVATSLYIPSYVFIAMRRVYGQSRFVTLLKFVPLAFAYTTGFSIIIATTFLIAAFSI